MRLALEQPRCHATDRRIIVQVPHELRLWRPCARAQKVHLQTVAVNDVGIEILKAPSQAPRVNDGRRECHQESRAEAEASENRPTRAPLAQPGERAREGHRRSIGISGGLCDERTAGCGNHRETPVGAGLAKRCEDVEQGSLRSSELSARAEENDSHSRRVRTFTWSPGLSTSVCFASIALR
jgi:hypothetical protein